MTLFSENSIFDMEEAKNSSKYVLMQCYLCPQSQDGPCNNAMLYSPLPLPEWISDYFKPYVVFNQDRINDTCESDVSSS